VRSSVWLVLVVLICAVGGWLGWRGEIFEPEPLFHDEQVMGADYQSWANYSRGSTLSMSVGSWMSDNYGGLVGHSSMGALCSKAEFRDFVRGLRNHQALFEPVTKGDDFPKHPFYQVSVQGKKTQYVWIVRKARALNPRESELVGYLEKSWLKLASRTGPPR
jgi:hypothetical protein